MNNITDEKDFLLQVIDKDGSFIFQDRAIEGGMEAVREEAKRLLAIDNVARVIVHEIKAIKEFTTEMTVVEKEM